MAKLPGDSDPLGRKPMGLPLRLLPQRTINQAVRKRGQRGLMNVLMLLALVLLARPTAHAKPFNEYQVKAVFVYNLTHFVTWPTEAFSAPKTPFVIGIIGKDPFNGILDQVLKGESYRSRPFVVRRYQTVQDLTVTRCHLLFVAADALADWPGIRQAIRDTTVVTVADVPNFCRQAGLVTLLTESGRIKVEINLAEARRCRFEVSSKLLNVSSICSNN